MKLNTTRDAVFRGQSNQKWDLQARIARPEIKGTRSVVEQRLLREFKRHSRAYLPSVPSNELEWLAVAQHHGLATRLLDWTSSPLAALWFAARDYETHTNDAKVWAFQPDKTVTPDRDIESYSLDPLGVREMILVHPADLSPRMSAQAGCFTLQPYEGPEGAVSCLASVRDLVVSAIVPYGCLGDILRELNRCGINQMTMFPGLDSIAGHLVWQNHDRTV